MSSFWIALEESFNRPEFWLLLLAGYNSRRMHSKEIADKLPTNFAANEFLPGYAPGRLRSIPVTKQVI
jgi:hypothetical protein